MWIFFIALLLTTLQLHGQDTCIELDQFLASGDIESAIKIANLNLDSNNPNCQNLIGETYLRRGRNSEAQLHFEKALSITKKDNADRANSLNNLGLVYWNTGNYILAKDHILRALDIRTILYGEIHEEIAGSMNDLGLVLSSTKPKKALEYYERALDIYQSLDGDFEENIALLKLNIGIIYRQLEFYGDAVNFFNDALTIWRNLHNVGHSNEGFIYMNLGQTSLAMNNEEEAMKFYNKALKIYLSAYGEKHPDVSYVYNLIGNLYHSNQAFDTALDYYQKALISNSDNFNNSDPEINPGDEHFYNSNTLLSTMFAKAQAFMDKSTYKTLKFGDLKLSLKTLYACDSLIDVMRQHKTNESDKIALGNSANQVYETGALLCYLMAYEAVRKERYYEQSFYFAEKNKSAVLLEAIADASAKSFANIPDSELDKESRFKEEIAFYDHELAKKPGGDLEKNYREKLFELRNKYSLFVIELEKNYPRYFDLKYNVSVPSITQLQATLDDETAIISYFLTHATKRIFVYLITKDKFKVENVPLTEDFFPNIHGLRNGISYNVYDLYKLSSEELYKALFPMSIPKKITNLLIIPDGNLGTIPFSALLTSKTKSKGNEDYGILPYLGKKYATGYEYASTLYFQHNLAGKTKDYKNAVFLCAPVKFKNMPDLPATRQEITALNEIFKGQALTTDIYMEQEANESMIKSIDLNNYKYLHFATHGVINEVNPQLSKLTFYKNKDDDGNLYTGEIYNLNLSAQLVTLSACETGLGLISKGEGIIGLSRAFAYAGAGSMLVTLWSVYDKSTAQMMIAFYSSIENDTFSRALQKAQLEFMKHPIYSNPYHWAPFILIGH